MKITIVLAQKIIGIFFSFFFGGDQLVFFYIYIYFFFFFFFGGANQLVSRGSKELKVKY